MAGADNISKSLDEALQTTDLTLEQLVGRAHELLVRVAPRQTRYKVTERPDVRTIRYYINQKLLPPPDGYRGGKARYGGTHLLRLLAIKKLQAEHQTLRQIGQVLAVQDDRQLAEMLGATQPRLELVPPAATPTPAQAPASIAVRRLALSPGGNLDLPETLMRDPMTRVKLADSLEAIARQLRQQAGDTPNTTDDSDKEKEPR